MDKYIVCVCVCVGGWVGGWWRAMKLSKDLILYRQVYLEQKN